MKKPLDMRNSTNFNFSGRGALGARESRLLEDVDAWLEEQERAETNLLIQQTVNKGRRHPRNYTGDY